MNPSICLNQISPDYSEYNVWCVLYRIFKCDMIEKIHMIPQTDKRGNSYQKAIVDFKQNIASEHSYQFFKSILEGKKKISCELRQHYWKVHFVPRPRVKVEPIPAQVRDARMAQECD
jgi:hypothetical protein